MRFPARSIYQWAARLGLILLAACAPGDGGTGPASPAARAFDLTVTPSTASILQGGEVNVSVIVTRHGGFKGDVAVVVSGNGDGFVSTLRSTQTIGSTTTVLISIVADIHLTPGVRELRVVGTAIGVTESEVPIDLTVTAAPPAIVLIQPDYASVIPGTAEALIWVRFERVNYNQPVALSVTDAPPGVFAALNPATADADEALLTLALPSALAPGDYMLSVHGKGNGIVEAVTHVLLRVTPPNLTMTLAPAVLNISPGVLDSSTLTVVRKAASNGVAPSLYFRLSAPPGVKAVFQGAPQSVKRKMWVMVDSGVTPGSYNLRIYASIGFYNDEEPGFAPVTLNVVGPAIGNFALRTVPAGTITVTQNAPATLAVSVDRTGGNRGGVALALTGALPAGMRLHFDQDNVSAAMGGAVLTITTAAATPVGTYPIVIHGNSFPLGEQTHNFNIVVVAPAGGAAL